ncbi:allophanate hydrolase subunit 2 [Thiobacillus denitrificans ATCC 25259]|uniref:Allophanate hydrolase subunit 2 n=1 Tax=Thiobacillus denitrificans (strain ATCC 25259 / T1) TaxID=292415 RepID=Q3SF51_THIDA|nr:biotin-dependent carboxyltransferase family protein [Thiobacillus denitrificans]AAZ98765.1 allophanate hydrolase subunit 2 [Thiobacillus denitrificans ATCC 25259]
MIEVLRAGLCDLVMDAGRPGRGVLGVPAGGAADPAALAAANALVGNAADAAGLEIALVGPQLRFPQGGVVALCGAVFSATRRSAAAVAWNQTLTLAAGETLQLGEAIDGCRCWLAVRGGLVVPPVIGSRSTFLPGAFGGHAGRALRSGDRLAVGAAAGTTGLRRAHPPQVEGPLRVVAGPQADLFDDRGLAAFFLGRYQVAAASDRRGIRLAGTPVTGARRELPSQGVLPGCVQVPPGGQPIILGWDGPVTGGYPVIACVIDADRARLAQLRPGAAVQFTTVGVEEARSLAAGADWRIEVRG